MLSIMLGTVLLLAAATGAAAPPRTLVLVLDGVPYTAVAGQGLFQGIGRPVPMVGPFPSVTSPAFAAMTAPLGVQKPPGYEARFFDRDQDALHLLRPASGTKDPIHWHASFDWMESGLSRKTMHYAKPRSSARREMREALAAFEASDDPIFLAYINSTDGLGHLYGPEETRAFLRELDHALGALRARLPFRTVLLSDHGMAGDEGTPLANVRQDVARSLEAAGFRLRESLDRPRDAVLVALGIVTFFAVYGAPEDGEELLTAAISVPGVELCARPDGDGWLVAGAAGRARIARDGTRWAYTALTGDPLRYQPVLERLRTTPETTWFEDRAWFAATLEADFPDALHRIAGGFTLVANPASVLCSTAPRHVFGGAAAAAGARMSRGPIRWSHGSLRREDTLGFFLTDVPGIDPAPAVRVDDALSWLH